jgi:hypothetical protein
MERRLLLHIIVGQRPFILQLLASENQTLLVRRNTLLVLNLLLDVLNRVTALHIQGNCLASQRLHKNLHLLYPSKKDSVYAFQIVKRDSAGRRADARPGNATPSPE